MGSFEEGYTAFVGHELLVQGSVEEVVSASKKRIDAGTIERIAIYENHTARVLDFDFRGTLEEVLGRLSHHPIVGDPKGEPAPRKGPGRPKLGVVSKEVTLLPRHWDWLGEQRGGASATLRRLVEEARRKEAPGGPARKAQEATYRFMGDMAADFPGFEEASRSFFAQKYDSFFELIGDWPPDVRDHLHRLVERQRGLKEETSPPPGRP